MRDVVIIGGARTAIGNYMGSLAGFTSVDLGVFAVKGALQKTGVDIGDIQCLVAGHVNQSGAPGNSARHIAVRSGLPIASYAYTIHQQCASSMRAAECLSQDIMLGKYDIGIVVGIESMSTAPYLLMGARKGVAHPFAPAAVPPTRLLSNPFSLLKEA